MDTKKSQIRIENLAACPGYADTVAGWIFHEFVEQHGEHGLDFVIERFRSRNADAPPMTLIALYGDKCAGAVSLFDNDLKTRPDLKPWLAGLYVDVPFRNRGIAVLLINALIEKTAGLGYSRILLRTEHAADYYSSRGWAFQGTGYDEYSQMTNIFYRDLKTVNH